MDRTERFYKIDQLLKDGKVVTFARFQDALGVSSATLKRDLRLPASGLASLRPPATARPESSVFVPSSNEKLAAAACDWLLGGRWRQFLKLPQSGQLPPFTVEPEFAA